MKKEIASVFAWSVAGILSLSTAFAQGSWFSAVIGALDLYLAWHGLGQFELAVAREIEARARAHRCHCDE